MADNSTKEVNVPEQNMDTKKHRFKVTIVEVIYKTPVDQKKDDAFSGIQPDIFFDETTSSQGFPKHLLDLPSEDINYEYDSDIKTSITEQEDSVDLWNATSLDSGLVSPITGTDVGSDTSEGETEGKPKCLLK